MEEESSKFDILTVLIIIAIVIVGYFLYRSPVENELSLDQSQNSATSESFNELELLTISSSISEECELLLNEYLYLKGISEASPKELFIELNLLTEQEFKTASQNNLVQISGNNYIETKIVYETFKNKMLDYVTEDLFQTEFASYKNHNGHVAVIKDESNIIVYEIENMKLTSYDNNLYTFDIEYTMQSSDNQTQNLTVTFLESNGKYLISNILF